MLERRRLGGDARSSRQLDDAHDLRGLGAGDRAQLQQRFADVLDRAGRTVHELCLDLREPGDDRHPFENRDIVDRDLDAVDQSAVPAGFEHRDQLELGAAEDSREEPRERRRQRPRAPWLLELEAALAARQLQLPFAHPVLDASAQRDSGTKKTAIGGVVIAGREDVRVDRHAAEPIDLDVVSLELELPLDRCPSLRRLRRVSVDCR